MKKPSDISFFDLPPYKYPLQAKGINREKRIAACIVVTVDSRPFAQRIALDIPSKRRVIIAEAVVVEVRLRILLLPRKAQVVVERAEA
jgi:hypothetical protein